MKWGLEITITISQIRKHIQANHTSSRKKHEWTQACVLQVPVVFFPLLTVTFRMSQESKFCGDNTKAFPTRLGLILQDSAGSATMAITKEKPKSYRAVLIKAITSL